ncbi:ArsR family transcriptional regulator [Desulfobaculum xiamenense]|uniref:ArsR family transcriptional regulator n=1 Tax=Desulfobaculum xiamenense TaxID=995050 RepID=A0A846QNV0_9BACT|nr:metalloregulator ArsR/SmtB family transcription factor [Desulfobaculum xiamenense]NJB68142.1 ArsR family transcriptional regulator [Desulfobaculum xiamenense]
MQILNFAKAIADPTRLRLMSILHEHELAVGEIVEVLSLKQSRISRHLKILSDAGLVQSRRDGQWVFYTGTPRGEARRFLDAIDSFVRNEEELAEDATRATRVVAARRKETARFFGSIAGDWDRIRHETLGGLDIAGIVAKRMHGATTAADLGCGTGGLLNALATHAQRVIGVDNSTEMLERARESFGERAGASGSVSLRIGDLEHLPLADGEADFAVMCLALHHLASPVEGVREAHRALAPGSRFILADFERHELESMRTESGDRWLGFDPDTVRAWLTDTGFTIANEDRFDLPSGLGLRLFEAVKQ